MSDARFYLGNGCAPDGYRIVELAAGDGPMRVPLETSTAQVIVCDHLLETLDPERGAALLRELRRALVQGGILRLATPDLDSLLADAFEAPLTEDGPYRTHCRRLNEALRTGIRWVYDEEELDFLAGQLGLVRIDIDTGPADESVWAKPAVPSIDDPTVSIVITAFNPRFYGEALRSALEQTYARIEIVVGDDCPDGRIREITESFADPRIRYRRNSPALGGPDNRMACFRRARGDYVKFLNDDDLLAPDCVRRMAACLVAYPDVTLVTSYRRRIGEHGEVLAEIPATTPPVQVPSRLDGASAAATMINQRRNFIGEPSTAMFRKADLATNTPHILSFAGRSCIPNGDVTMWSHLLGKGDAVYLTEALSSFRVHPDQMQNRAGYGEIGRQAWEQMRDDAQRLGLAGAAAPRELAASPIGLKPWWPEEAIRLVLGADADGEAGNWTAALEKLQRALDEVPGDAWLTELVASATHLRR
jgi:hypothetical protein